MGTPYKINIEAKNGGFEMILVSCLFFQELAAVATQLPDVRWLGRQIFMWCGNPKEDDVLRGAFLAACDEFL